jgi:hypothetical protein
MCRELIAEQPLRRSGREPTDVGTYQAVEAVARVRGDADQPKVNA